MAKYLDLAGTTLLTGKLKDDATAKANNAASGAVSVHDNNVNAHSTLLSGYVKTTLQIAGKPLTGNISVAELTAALSVATQSLQGMLSSIDKKKIDDLWAIFDNGANENFVDTLTEILEIFQNYPQGADIMAQLAGKVDKVAGKELSTNDLTDELKQDYDTAVAQTHTHDNKSILDDITAAYTQAEKDKLAEIDSTIEQMIDTAKQDIDPKVDEIEGELVYVPNTPDSDQMFDKIKLYGNSVQNGEPTPENPVPIENVPSEFDIISTNNTIPELIETKTIQIKDTDNNLHDLCSLPDGTADSVEDGKIIKKVKTLSFDNADDIGDNWNYYNINYDDKCLVYYMDDANAWGADLGYTLNARCSNAKISMVETVGVLRVNRSAVRTILSYVQTNSAFGILSDDNAATRKEKAKNWVRNQINTHGNIVFQYPYVEPQVYDLHPDQLEKLKTLKSFSGGTFLTTDTTVNPIINLDYLKIDSDPNYVQFVGKDGKTLAPYTKGNMVGIGEAGGEVVYLTDDDGKIQQISPDGSIWELSITNAGVASWAKKV